MADVAGEGAGVERRVGLGSLRGKLAGDARGRRAVQPLLVGEDEHACDDAAAPVRERRGKRRGKRSFEQRDEMGLDQRNEKRSLDDLARACLVMGKVEGCGLRV